MSSVVLLGMIALLLLFPPGLRVLYSLKLICKFAFSVNIFLINFWMLELLKHAVVKYTVGTVLTKTVLVFETIASFVQNEWSS